MITIIAIILTVIGALNWGLVGAFNFNLVSWITFGNQIASTIIYIIVAISGLWLLAYLLCSKGQIGIKIHKENDKDTLL